MYTDLYKLTDDFLRSYLEDPNILVLIDRLSKKKFFEFDFDHEDFKRFVLLPSIILISEGFLDDSKLDRLLVLTSYLGKANQIDDFDNINSKIEIETIKNPSIQLYMSRYLKRKREVGDSRFFSSYSLQLQMRYILLYDFLTEIGNKDLLSNNKVVNGLLIVVYLLVLQKMMDDLSDLRTDAVNKHYATWRHGLYDIDEFRRLDENEQNRVILGEIIPKFIENIVIYYKKYLCKYENFDDNIRSFFERYSLSLITPIIQVSDLYKSLSITPPT